MPEWVKWNDKFPPLNLWNFPIKMISEKDIKDYGEAGHPQPKRQLTANDIQYGGTHYKQFKDLQPWDVVTAWNLGYLEGTALKYIARWQYKGGIEDLKKAVHFLQKKIEVETNNVKHKE